MSSPLNLSQKAAILSASCYIVIIFFPCHLPLQHKPFSVKGTVLLMFTWQSFIKGIYFISNKFLLNKCFNNIINNSSSFLYFNIVIIFSMIYRQVFIDIVKCGRMIVLLVKLQKAFQFSRFLGKCCKVSWTEELKYFKT